MALFCNFCGDGVVLLETTPQCSSTPVKLGADAERLIEQLLAGDDVSAALGALFVAGCQAGERAVRLSAAMSTAAARKPAAGG